ncbi:MAG: RsmB/NOP family class I SAM-dependent RNA methyltransferase [Bacteroidia bacterium]|nr:RsmB/NOP family class I SAM-dependent RNA methyltransferase [Bacteroidia bacterium]
MSLPQAFVSRMQARLGSEAHDFFCALATPPKTAVRWHPQKGISRFVEARPVPWHPLGQVLEQRPPFEREPLWHAGAYYVQEASSMSLRAFLPEKRPLRIIDLSAAPGGKATLVLAELGLEGGLLIANDPDPARRIALQENLERWGIPAYFITGRHPRYWAERYPEAFDVVILDAPCSGEGLWRKDSTAMRQWSTQLVQRMRRLQRSLLFAAKALVAPDGRLIYSTCTFAPEENEENLAYLMQDESSWHPVLWSNAPPEVVSVSYGNKGVGYYFYPHRSVGEGFFISAWERSGQSVLETQSWKTTPAPYPLPKGIECFRQGKMYYALTPGALAMIPPRWEREKWEAFPLGERIRPAHAAALMVGGMTQAFPERPISSEAFERYLRGELFQAQAPVEWVTVEGLGVGWLYKGRPSLPFTWRRFLRNRCY